VEVYPPIPESAVRHAPRWLRTLTWLLVAAAALFAVVKVTVFTWSDPISDQYKRFGAVETRFGPALAKCGGEGGLRCGEGTGLIFARCASGVNDYFWSSDNQDARARRLIGRRPPSGDQWGFEGCWWSGWGPFPSQPIANLQSL